MRRHCYSVSVTTLRRLVRCATRWTPEKGRLVARPDSEQVPATTRRASRVRTPRCCCHSCSRRPRRPYSAATRVSRACDIIVIDTSTTTSARRSCSRPSQTIKDKERLASFGSLRVIPRETFRRDETSIEITAFLIC